MAAILNSAILDSPILHKTLTQTFSLLMKASFSLNLMMAAILNSAILHSTILHKKTSLIHSDSNWWWWPSWILPSCIQPFCTKLWLKLIQSDSNSFILTQPDYGSHLEFCHLAFIHFAQKKLHSFILTQIDDGGHLEFCHLAFNHFSQNSDSNSFNLTQTHSFWLNLMMAAILNSAMLNLDTWHLGFRHLVIFSQIHSKTLSLHSDSELKLIQSDSNSFLLT